jgi:hypothetical protein
MEDALRERFAGTEFACVAVSDLRLGDELGVVCAGRAERREVFEFLRARFGHSFDPARFAAVESLPLNASAKVDRAACGRLLAGASAADVLQFPIPVSRLARWLPHEGSAIWVDEVSWVTASDAATEGECLVRVRNRANYRGPRGVRQSSAIEWMAQSYGYACAARALARAFAAGESTPEEPRPTRVFLVAIRGAEWPGGARLERLSEGDQVRIHVRESTRIGPITLVEAQACATDGECLARAQLRLFAE